MGIPFLHMSDLAVCRSCFLYLIVQVKTTIDNIKYFVGHGGTYLIVKSKTEKN